MTTRFRINTPDVILENFGDEVVIVNLSNGNYYSVDAVGAEVWALIEKGYPTAAVLADLSRRYDGDPATIDTALTQFVTDLLADNLIVPVAGDSQLMDAIADTGLTAKQPFKAPILNKYTDMQELLLLDPIHEVDETGWPTVKPNDN